MSGPVLPKQKMIHIQKHHLILISESVKSKNSIRLGFFQGLI